MVGDEGGDVETGRAAEASAQLFDILLQEDNPEAIFDSLARIVGETLEVDRSLIYDVSFIRDQAIPLTEWLNPKRPEITPTKAVYPLALFRTAAKVAFERRDVLESHVDRPHPAMVADRSATLLHGQMQIQSLLWYPFMFRADGFWLLVFNHVGARHVWQPAELEFMRAATRHVSMALLKIDLIRERARAEVTMFEAQKLESLGLLAGGVAHDFNNLMVGVVSNAELLARRLPPDPSLARLVEGILHAGQRAANLAGQLLAYAGKGQPGVTRVHLAEVVESTIKLVRPSIPNVPIQISVEDAPPIECNTAQLEQVVMNLIVNAAEACPVQGGRIDVRISTSFVDGVTAPVATLLPPAPGRYVLLAVADNGVGMDAATMKRIFNPFFTTKRTGRGLGLSAVLGIIKHHGGAIGITSTPGAGTTFTVFWPASEGPVTVAPTVREATTSEGLGRTVLCIDDDPDVAAAVAGLLVDAGYTCHLELGGAAGLARFAARPDELDLAVVDVTMPGLGGREVLRELRRIRPDLPVILMSGFTADPSIDDLTDDLTRFIHKPFRGDALLAAARAVLTARTPHPR